MSELVDRLCSGEHEVEVSLRPERTGQLLQDSIDRGYVHIKFTGTRGGTELGLQLDRNLTRLQDADVVNQKGLAHIVGNLTLDYVKARVIADINLTTFSGTGHLERVVE
jgi:hypothetical protein